LGLKENKHENISRFHFHLPRTIISRISFIYCEDRVKSIFFGVNLKQQLNLNPLWGWKNAWHLGVDVESVDVSEEYQ